MSVHVGFGGLHVGGSILDIRIARLVVSSVEEWPSVRKASAVLGVPRSTLGARYRRAQALLASLEQLDAPETAPTPAAPQGADARPSPRP